MTNACVSITKTLMMGIKLITERYKITHIKNIKVRAKIIKRHKKNSYIFLHNNDCISVVSDNILRICIQELLLILKTFTVLLHNLSANNSLLVH